MTDEQIQAFARSAIGIDPDSEGKTVEITFDRPALMRFARALLDSHLIAPVEQTVPGEASAKPIRPVAYVTEDDHKRLLAEKWVSVEATPMGFDVPCVALYTGKQVDWAVLDERDNCAKIVDMLAVEFARAQTGGAWRAVKHAANLIRNGRHGADTDRLTPNEKESPASPADVLIDAERYRWLRENINGPQQILLFDDCGRDPLDNEALDFAIDAAMKAKP